jgi:hypothetical protein
VTAPLNFIVPGAEKPFAYTYEPPPGVPQRTGTYAAATVAIRDARRLRPPATLDREGFALTPHLSRVTDFYDESQIRSIYYAELEALVRAQTGASRVLVFDHNLRFAPKKGAAGVKEPVKRVHNDYTETSGPQRVRDLLPDEADELLKNRFAVINVWRPISAPVEESPLALCDARSMAPADFIATDLIYRDRRGETYGVAHSDGQRWFYYPRMRPDEALFIKCYDSARDGRARFTAHGAFEDPTSPANARPRESIEARTIAFFD